ncbi:MAG: thioredoxin [Gammaproteobacteria bacterium (ex Lamellibrachia satsuma)]|nr:MAG: tetratricopeptide repeat protein [Gammaproteobacteria bacterium (ex Lamellibrachia satsuma)]RRS34436.1 MAG: thioredoxin [Gammaproteobacteria bacterium (ex Lamellibrachia satsuma)]RRS35098.1 MAG: thioredoxin [Gammaproteobacteria bacterium (ex Lamellibrachia satsuma)]
MAAASFIFEGTSGNFDRLVLENSRRGLVLVDFWAPWVGPSMRQREMLSNLAQEYAGRFLLVSVNTDEQKPLAERFGVRSLPSLKLFKNGEMLAEYHGVQPEADYPRIIDEYAAKLVDQVSAGAIAAWQAGDPDKALQLLAEAAVSQPDNLSYPALMAKILMRQDRIDDAHQLLCALPEVFQNESQISGLLAHLDFLQTAAGADAKADLEARITATPEDAEARYQLAAVCLHEDEIEQALEHLLLLSRQVPVYRNGIARKGMKALLDMLDSADERVARYRKELFRLNY